MRFRIDREQFDVISAMAARMLRLDLPTNA